MSDAEATSVEVDYRVLFQQSTVPMLTLDLRARSIVAVNQATEQLLGLPAEQVLGRPGRDFLSDPSPDHVLRLRGLRGERTRAIAAVRTATGERTVDLSQIPAGPEGMVFVQAIDLTDLVESNIELEERTAQLQARSGTLETFAARVAHDLRSPLASIAGFADLLQREDFQAGPEERAQLLQRIAANARSLANMIGEVMAEATSRSHDEPATFDSVEDLFAGVRAVLEGELLSSGGRLATSTEVDHLSVPLSVVRQPLLNLVSNSIKYRDPSRALFIEVTVADEDDHTVIRVRDNGRGVGDDAESLFRRGERGASSSGTVGSGLGLAFARQALRDLGAELSVEVVVGPGACFRIDLPAAGQPASAPVVGRTLGSGLRSGELDAVFVHSPVPSLLIDLEHRRILRANRAATALLGMSEREIVGRAGRDLLTDPEIGDVIRDQILGERRNIEAAVPVQLKAAGGPVSARVVASGTPDSSLAVIQVLEP